jgi:hypothetical protein
MLEATEAFNNVDVIKDFNISTDNDVLDISDILDATAYNHGVDLITNWAEITTSGADSVVKVDRDGTGVPRSNGFSLLGRACRRVNLCAISILRARATLEPIL